VLENLFCNFYSDLSKVPSSRAKAQACLLCCPVLLYLLLWLVSDILLQDETLKIKRLDTAGADLQIVILARSEN
jgi:hypothetical protein